MLFLRIYKLMVGGKNKKDHERMCRGTIVASEFCDRLIPKVGVMRLDMSLYSKMHKLIIQEQQGRSFRLPNHQEIVQLRWQICVDFSMKWVSHQQLLAQTWDNVRKFTVIRTGILRHHEVVKSKVQPAGWRFFEAQRERAGNKGRRENECEPKNQQTAKV